MSQIIKDLISNYTAGEILTANDAVYVSDGTGVDSGRTAGRVYKLEIATAGRDSFAGFSKQSVAAAAQVKVITSGRLKGFSGLPIGSVVYASAVAGGFTSTKPTSNVQVLGSVESATVLIVNASLGSASSNLVDGALVGTTDAQTIINKTQDDEILIKELAVTPSTPAAGYKKIYPRLDGSVYSLNSLGAEEAIGSGGAGGGGLDAFIVEDFETTGSGDLLSGKNAAFDGGGVLGGVLSDETASQIAGTRSIKYVTNAVATSSNDDYFYLPAHTLDAKQKGQDVGVNFYYNSSIADDLMEVVIWDDTNNVKLNSTLDTLKLSSDNKRYSTSVFIPSTCNAIKVGFQHVGVSEVSKSLIVDDIELSTNLFVYKDLISTHMIRLNVGNGHGSTNNAIRRFSNVISDTGSSNLISYTDSSTLGASFEILKDGIYNISYSDSGGASSWIGISLNSTQLSVNISSISEDDKLVYVYNNDGLTGNEEASWSGILSKGDIIRPHTDGSPIATTGVDFIITGTATTEHVITPLKSKPNTFAARIANNGTATVTSESSSFIQSVTVNGTGIVDVVWTPGYFSVAPSVQIDTEGVAGNSASRADIYNVPTISGFTYRTSDSTTNVPSNNNATLQVTRQGTDYTENFGLSATPTPKIAYIKDVKPSGTDGGTFTSGAWRTRDLNTLTGDLSFASISTNQITLQPGRYDISASIPAYRINSHESSIYNITDSVLEIMGSREMQASAENSQGISHISGIIEITSTTVFELQHWCQTTKTTDGFGVQNSQVLSGNVMVYSQVKITKLR